MQVGGNSAASPAAGKSLAAGEGKPAGHRAAADQEQEASEGQAAGEGKPAGHRAAADQEQEASEGQAAGEGEPAGEGKPAGHRAAADQEQETGEGLATAAAAPSLLSVGFLIGLLAGEGHFGGDGRQPHVTLRMHVRHEGMFRWIERNFPGGRLYGPYSHGGRSYFQWMARGAFLREQIAPLIQRHRHLLDDYVAGRFDLMCRRYTIGVGTDPQDGDPPP